MQTGALETLIGWKSGKTNHVPLWGRMEGANLFDVVESIFKHYRRVLNVILKKSLMSTISLCLLT
jgi:hypothetical protein